MYTAENSSHSFWASLFHESRLSKFTSCVIITLLLLYTPSGGQLIPSSQSFSNKSSPSNTALSSNSLKEYVIYSVVEGSSQESDNERIRLHLGMILAPADVQEYGGYYTGVEFWRVNMNDMQRTAFVSANPRAQVHENAQFLYHEDIRLSENPNQNASEPVQPLGLSSIPSGTSVNSSLGAETIYQSDAPSDLKVVSWAPGVPFDRTKAYAYNPGNGGNSIIYVIENGIDGHKHEFFWPPPDWLYAPSVRRTETDDDPNSHGSCVASKAAGAKNGVSKTTRLVVVKSSLNLADIAWAFQQISNDVARQKNKRVVVLLAATTKTPWRPEDFQDARFSRLYLRMQNLINLGAVVVVPAGNYAKRSLFADTVPAVFASLSRVSGQQPLPLLVAGAVDKEGAAASWSQTTLTGIAWAPGVDVTCTKSGWNLRSTASGTSVSAGMVAGLAAYFLDMKKPPFGVGRLDTAQNLIEYLQISASWARRPGRRKVIWNRLDGSLAPHMSTAAAGEDHETSHVVQE